MTATQAPAADQPPQTTINDDRAQPGQASSDLARQDLYWNAIALPDGQMLAAAAARLLGRLSALAAQWDGGREGRPGTGPAPDPGADKAAALTLIKASHQLLCTAIGVPAGARAAREGA
jgi:hypothetical protein